MSDASTTEPTVAAKARKVACPRCGLNSELSVQAQAWFLTGPTIDDEGTGLSLEPLEALDFDELSTAMCGRCGWHGDLRETFLCKDRSHD